MVRHHLVLVSLVNKIKDCGVDNVEKKNRINSLLENMGLVN